jgi:YqaJ-like viral recombinase domain.
MKSKITKIKWAKNLSMDDWGLARKKIEGIGDPDIVRIGASDVSVITGTNRWKCPMRLFYHLTGYHHSFFITETTLAGHLQEPITISRWESFDPNSEEQSYINALNKVKLRKTSKAEYFLLNSAYPHSFLSLDYTPKGKQFSPFTGEQYAPLTPIELKHSNAQYVMKWPDGIAAQYYDQILYQCLLTNTPLAVFLVLIDGVKFKAKEIEANPIRQQFIIEQVNLFAEKVKIGKMALQGMKEAELAGDMEEYAAFHAIFESVTPEPVGMVSSDGTDGDNVELLKEVYDDSNGLEKQGDDTDEYHMNQYLKCNSLLNKIKDYKDLLKARILLACEDFEGLKAGDRKCINRRPTNLKKGYFSIK